MARRMLHDSIFESKQFSLLSKPARLLYIGLIVLGDDDGRLKGDPALLRSKVFPRDPDITVEDVSTWLEETVAAGLITRYSMNGDEYLSHPNWLKYQTLRADRKKDSNIPPPPDSEDATNTQPSVNQKSAQDKIREEKVRKEKIDALFTFFWQEYPNKKVKKKAYESWQRIFRDAKDVEALSVVIFKGLGDAKRSPQWTKNEGQYVPHPTTWLNQERWTDEGTSGGAPKKTHKV